MLHKILLVLSAAIFAALVGCSDPPKQPVKAKEPPKPPEPITGRQAFHPIYVYARNWATDLQVLRINNIPSREFKADPGKSAAWQATLVSPGSQRMRNFTYSIVEGEGNLHKGVFGQQEESYSERGQSKPFPMQAIKVDSDAAFKVAAGKSADYMKKNPDKAINFQLELTPRCKNPAWRVYWGDSISTSNYSILVDASTGEFCQTLR
jgi:hypothetical protein